jgi:hypothetical protein
MAGEQDATTLENVTWSHFEDFSITATIIFNYTIECQFW